MRKEGWLEDFDADPAMVNERHASVCRTKITIGDKNGDKTVDNVEVPAELVSLLEPAKRLGLGFKRSYRYPFSRGWYLHAVATEDGEVHFAKEHSLWAAILWTIMSMAYVGMSAVMWMQGKAAPVDTSRFGVIFLLSAGLTSLFITAHRWDLFIKQLNFEPLGPRVH